MSPMPISLNDYFMFLLFGGFPTVEVVMIPVQINSKLSRLRRKRTRATCRICGYRFLRPENKSIFPCPHCGVNNKL